MATSNPATIGMQCEDWISRRSLLSRAPARTTDLFRGGDPEPSAPRAPPSTSGTIYDLARIDAPDRRHLRPRTEQDLAGAAGAPSWLRDAPRGIRVGYRNDETSKEQPIGSGRRPATRERTRDPVLEGEMPQPVRPRARGAWQEGLSADYDVMPGGRAAAASRRPESAPIAGVAVFTGPAREPVRARARGTPLANVSRVGGLLDHSAYTRAAVHPREELPAAVLARTADEVAAGRAAATQRGRASTLGVAGLGTPEYSRGNRIGEPETSVWSSMYSTTIVEGQKWQARAME